MLDRVARGGALGSVVAVFLLLGCSGENGRTDDVHDANSAGTGGSTSAGSSSDAGATSTAGASSVAGAGGATGGGTSGGATSVGGGGVNTGAGAGAPAGGSDGEQAGEGGGAGLGSAGTGGSDDRVRIPTRFVGFVETADTPLLASEGYPECPRDPAGQQVFDECVARSIVESINSAVAELTSDAPVFYFESLEIVVDPTVSVLIDEGEIIDSYQAQKLQGNKYRKKDTMTFTMPRASESSAGGAAFVDQRLSPDFGMLAIAAADQGTDTFLHELGHAFGFPHVGTFEAVGALEYGSCGGASVTPDACTCASGNYMGTGALPNEEDGCAPCPFLERNTFATPAFRPFLAHILECWTTKRLTPTDLFFTDGECAAFARSQIVPCDYDGTQTLTCTCPSGTTFPIDSCMSDAQDARNALAEQLCEKVTCEPPPERPGFECIGLEGGAQIECICEDGLRRSYLTDCSQVEAGIELACPDP